jgi:PAS domain S-box-containing protein
VRDLEFSAFYDDQTVRTLFGHGVPLRDEFGRVRGAVGAFVDITERKRTEATLHRYELLARHTRDIVLFIRRADGRILEANAAAESAYGLTRDELVARTIHDLRFPDDAPSTPAQMAEADAVGLLFEAHHQRRDGSPFAVEVSSRGMTIGGERLLLSVIRDITERRRAEQSLRESERRTTAVLNAVSESIWLLDPDTRVLLASATASARLGRSTPDVLGRTMNELLPRRSRQNDAAGSTRRCVRASRCSSRTSTPGWSSTTRCIPSGTVRAACPELPSSAVTSPRGDMPKQKSIASTLSGTEGPGEPGEPGRRRRGARGCASENERYVANASYRPNGAGYAEFQDQHSRLGVCVTHQYSLDIEP